MLERLLDSRRVNVMLPSQIEDRNDAAKLLVKFIADYTNLLQCQIGSIKTEMATVVNEVMESVNKLNSAQIEKTKMAESILLKDEKQQKVGFKEVSAKQKSVDESEKLKHAKIDINKIITTNVKKAGTQLKEYMRSLENLDAKMQDLILTMVGAMSADDVVGQRLDHVGFALQILGGELAKVVQDFEKNFTPSGIEKFGQQINNEVFARYTMPEERESFIRVQGYAPSVKRGS